MKCTLMHQRTSVANLELDDSTGFIQKINTVYAPNHLPIGVLVRRGIVDRAALNEWWIERSIPASRSGIREALEILDISSTKPFKKHHSEQLRLVSDFSWIDFDSLLDVEEMIIKTLSEEDAKEYIDESRIRAIVETVNRRIKNLQQISITQTPVQINSTEDDVEENIAKDYSKKMTIRQ